MLNHRCLIGSPHGSRGIRGGVANSSVSGRAPGAGGPFGANLQERPPAPSAEVTNPSRRFVLLLNLWGKESDLPRRACESRLTLFVKSFGEGPGTTQAGHTLSLF